LTALPHTLGVVTDLDRGPYRRLLRMLGAEARRREVALAAAGASNFGWLDARGGAARPAIPRLLVVVDEFASLVVELPDLTAGLVELARRGRRLGIHLVLCTLRAAGAVPAELQAVLSARICLRVDNEADSLEVLGSPAAATLPPSAPGRALRSVHGRPPRPVQVAELTEDDAGAVVAAVAAAAGPDAEPRWRPWPPPLPAEFVLEEAHPRPTPAGFTAVVGLVDLPDELAQAPWEIDLDRSGAVLAVGTTASGKTTWLTTVVRSLAAGHGEGWDLYAASLDGELTDLARLPQRRVATAASDTAQAHDLVLVADAELTRRRVGARLLTDDPETPPRAGAAAGARGQGRRLVVAVDRLDLLLERGDADELSRAIRRLAVDGRGAGVHLIATAGPDGAGRRGLARQFPRLLLLWLGDPRAYAGFDVAPGDAPDPYWQPAGRGLWLPDRVEVQVARVGGC
jgi:DNA segregation ATPase FtsK/SpoIIIE, S-DNA-T family